MGERQRTGAVHKLEHRPSALVLTSAALKAYPLPSFASASARSFLIYCSAMRVWRWT